MAPPTCLGPAHKPWLVVLAVPRRSKGPRPAPLAPPLCPGPAPSRSRGRGRGPARRRPVQRLRRPQGAAAGARGAGGRRGAAAARAAARALRQPRQLALGGQGRGAAPRHQGAGAGRPEPRRQPPQPAHELRGHERGRAAPPGPPGRHQVRPAGAQHGRQDCHGAGPAADLVERLISVDISPSTTAAVSEFSGYVSAMRSVKIPEGLPRSAARRLADEQLRPTVQLPELRQFLLTNLVEVEGRYMWRVNLEAISHHLSDIMSFPVFHKPYPGPTLFLGGSKSPYISPKDYPEIQRLFPKADIQFIEGAGHIVHQDKFEEFMTAVLNFLPPP